MKLASIAKGLALVGALSLAGLTLATNAMADGGPRRGSIKDAPVGPPPFSWTGFYVGLNAGAAWADQDYRHTPTGAWASAPADIPFLASNGSGGLSSRSFTGGAQAGYNWQAGTLVFGLEADINALNNSKSRVLAAPTGVAATGVYTTSVDGDWFGTLRARLGFASNNFLLYVTGGLAYGEHNISQNVFFNVTGSRASGSRSDTSTGWVVGGGLEWALNRNWTLRGEYLHVDLGSVNVGLVNPAFSTFTHTVKSELEFDIVRLGINYKF